MGSPDRCVALLLALHAAVSRSQRAPLPFPPLTNFSADELGRAVFAFDGLDYAQLPDHIRPEYQECYQESYRCLRFRHYIIPVCGYNLQTWVWSTYVNLCQLNLENCLEMLELKRGMFGNKLSDRVVYYLGDGENCERYMKK